MHNGHGPGASAAQQAAGAGSMAELRQRRLELAEQVAALTWDLGGLTYEMAIRDHYRLDVLALRAAELQKADAELGETERLLGAAEAGIAGHCRSCGAMHSRGAAYCWRCGAGLLTEARPASLSQTSPPAKDQTPNSDGAQTPAGTTGNSVEAGLQDTQVLHRPPPGPMPRPPSTPV